MSKRILIVDDEKDLGELVDLMLRKAKLDVVCRRLSRGLAALEACQKDPPNLLLLDVALPDIHGLEVLRKLKADAATAHIPVVVITALRGEIVSEAVASGAAGTLLKPFNRAELLQAVTTALQLPG